VNASICWPCTANEPALATKGSPPPAEQSALSSAAAAMSVRLVVTSCRLYCVPLISRLREVGLPPGSMAISAPQMVVLQAVPVVVAVAQAACH
jgi:hypothetical protein